MSYNLDNCASSPKVFISHSKHDKKGKDFIEAAFQRTEVTPLFYEMDKTDPYAVGFSQIRDGIADEGTRATFVMLCPEMLVHDSLHTRNWIDFEVGLSCASGLPVWIFEPSSRVPFSVPYCKMRKFYDATSEADRDYVHQAVVGIAQILRPQAYSLTPTISEAPDNGTPGKFIICSQCHLPFRQIDPVGLFPCPACRVLIDHLGGAPDPSYRG